MFVKDVVRDDIKIEMLVRLLFIVVVVLFIVEV